MAKKAKKRQLDMIINFVVTLLGIAAIVMMVLPNVGINDSDKAFTGLQIAFGYNRKVGNSEVALFYFSFMNLLTFILAAVGVVFTVLGALGKGSKFAAFIAAGAFIVAGVFFFLSISFCLPNQTVLDIGSIVGANVKDALHLAVGAIVGGVVSLLAGIAQLGRVFLK